MTAYYNEKDPFAAQWLRNLIAGGMIAPGDVDERSIEDVVPLGLLEYTQCHFFAGIGVWSYAMRRAGWADDRRAWTGSCPCQPFSQAGEGAGFADERHLWPAFFHLIEQCGPDVVFGEQVASKDGLAWLDLVQSDVEAAGYAFGALDTCAAGYGAPHIRQRMYWMAHHHSARLERRPGVLERGNKLAAWPYGLAGGVADSDGLPWRQGRTDDGGSNPGGDAQTRPGPWGSGSPGGVANPDGREPSRHGNSGSAGSTAQGLVEPTGHGSLFGPRPGPVNGFWNDVDWLRCKDDKWRPVEPGTFPLVNGAPNRVGLLRGYGNGLVLPQAEEFIRAAMEYAP